MWSKKDIKHGFQSSHPRDGCNVVDLLLVVADGVLLLADRHEEGRHLGLVGRQRVVVLLDLGFQVAKHHRLGVQVLPDLTGLQRHHRHLVLQLPKLLQLQAEQTKRVG